VTAQAPEDPKHLILMCMVSHSLSRVRERERECVGECDGVFQTEILEMEKAVKSGLTGCPHIG